MLNCVLTCLLLSVIPNKTMCDQCRIQVTRACSMTAWALRLKKFPTPISGAVVRTSNLIIERRLLYYRTISASSLCWRNGFMMHNVLLQHSCSRSLPLSLTSVSPFRLITLLYTQGLIKVARCL